MKTSAGNKKKTFVLAFSFCFWAASFSATCFSAKTCSWADALLGGMGAHILESVQVQTYEGQNSDIFYLSESLSCDSSSRSKFTLSKSSLYSFWSWWRARLSVFEDSLRERRCATDLFNFSLTLLNWRSNSSLSWRALFTLSELSLCYRCFKMCK